MNKGNNQEIIKKIVIERVRAMSPNVKIALGSTTKSFLDKNQLIEEINNNTDVGKKIINIQMRYVRALKEGLV